MLGCAMSHIIDNDPVFRQTEYPAAEKTAQTERTTK